MTTKSSFSLLIAFSLIAAVSTYAGGDRKEKREAFKACATELGISLPDRKGNPEQREIIKSCMKEAGFKKRDHSDVAKVAREKCFADNKITKPKFERPSGEKREQLKACLAKKGFTRGERT